MDRLFKFIVKYKIELILLIFATIFSTWLMFSTFSYKDGSMVIAGKAWSDFGSHIPLIRSFSLGDNFPPEYPLFPGVPIKYHFLFYAFAGILEKAGLRIDYALNIPSVLGFIFLLAIIYLLAKEIFKSTAVGILSVLFFLFNGTLSFLNFFKAHPLSLNSLSQILSNQTFPSFGPYDHTSIVSAFWNLNIFTNQRHLAISYGLSLFIVYFFLHMKEDAVKIKFAKSAIIGIVLGVSFLINMAVFLMTIVVLLCLILFLSKKRIYVFTTLVLTFFVSLPLFLYTNSVASTFKITTHFGYLVENLSAVNFLNYWFHNLGIHMPLIILGFFIANKIQKKILISFLTLFLIGNLLQFSPEIAANHKFFNYFMLVGVMFSAYVLVYLWNKKFYFKPLVLALFFLTVLSGIIDFFPILNDGKITLADYPKDKDIAWIIKNTPKDAVFLNTEYFTTKASLAGRKIFLGWPYFSWSQGYDTLTRDNLRISLLKTDDLNYFCQHAENNNLSYAEIAPVQDLVINTKFFEQNFNTVYRNTITGVNIFNLKEKCDEIIF